VPLKLRISPTLTRWKGFDPVKTPDCPYRHVVKKYIENAVRKPFRREETCDYK